ncbi:hypothetical protein V1498_09005 [Peribacillus sp. SCS-26]|uniref:hypothetical protein n=1 Tax=Paraperibacillus marinus TaxID=3115295 RepID=UPI00390641F8
MDTGSTASNHTQVPAKKDPVIGSDPSRYYPGDSVDQHKEHESANAIIAEKEAGQQNENL